MPKWRRDSEFGPGPRVPIDRETRAVWKAKIKLARRPNRLTIAGAEVARVLLEMIGPDGRLDPSIETLAARAAVNPSTVTRALARLCELGFIRWTRRLVRDAASAWRTEQTTNAYVLTVPASDVHFSPGVPKLSLKQEGQQENRGDAWAYENAARQLRALGEAVPAAWGNV